MSKKPAALPIFGDAYLADTMHLSLEEHGAYFLLMLAAWRNDKCALPDDDVKLARICRCSTKRFKGIRGNILEMWDLTPDGWVQKRLKKEHEYVSTKSAHNKRAAEARWGSQVTENIEGDECERISECNAPPPPPTSEPKGSSDDDERADGRLGGELFSRDHQPPPAKAKPTRIPEDWKPTRPLPPKVHALVDGWPPGRYERELDGFRDFWASRSKNATMLDWDKAWHNRIRDQHDRIMRESRNGQGNRSSAAGQYGSGYRDPVLADFAGKAHT